MPRKKTSSSKITRLTIHKKILHHGKRVAKASARVASKPARGLHKWYRRRKIGHKIIIWLAIIVLVITSVMYGIAQWYINKHQNERLEIGASFIPNYARYLGIEPEDTLQAMIDDLGIRRFRLVTYWDKMEPEQGKYDFSDLDWQFDMIEKARGSITLSIGLRQPRWPECHKPVWARYMEESKWQEALYKYIQVVVERYKDRPSLVSYQLENEYLLSVFGECANHDRERLIKEFDLVKGIDATKPLIVSRSNNAVPSWPVGKPRADIVGAAVYKRVWDRTLTKRYFEYPLPAWYYAFLAGGTELTTGRNTFIHELQAEPWPPKGIKEVSLQEQDKSFNAKLLPKRIDYAVATGMKTIDLWGVEWWYWRKTVHNDASLWNAGKASLQKYSTPSEQCSRSYVKSNDLVIKSPCLEN